MDPDDRVVQSVRSPVVVGLTSTVGPEELSQRGRRIPTTSFSLEHFPHRCPGVKRASSSARALAQSISNPVYNLHTADEGARIVKQRKPGAS